MKANVKTNKVSEKAVNNVQPVDVQRANGRFNDLEVCDNISIEVTDDTTTKSVKPSGEKETANDLEASLSKNEVFAKLKVFFEPKDIEPFDESTITDQMSPLLTAGVITQSVVDVAIAKAKAEYKQKKPVVIAAAENISFSDFLERLKVNKKLYNEVLNACKLSEIDESKVFDESGNIVIYRGAQSLDKEGKERYFSEICTITDKLGKEHTATVYKELRTDHNVTNYIQAIRYYSTYSDTRAKLAKEAKECESVLNAAAKAIRKALETGFALKDITDLL